MRVADLTACRKLGWGPIANRVARIGITPVPVAPTYLVLPVSGHEQYALYCVRVRNSPWTILPSLTGNSWRGWLVSRN